MRALLRGAAIFAAKAAIFVLFALGWSAGALVKAARLVAAAFAEGFHTGRTL
jgi:hypothetical protein